jgi:putative NIF3 family GTP cyclohydrolase 1 type 2
MTSARDIVAYVEGLTGHALNRDEGFHHGRPDRPVKALTLAWMATDRALGAAGERGDDLFIGHESLYYPYDAVILDNPPAGWREWPINRRRRELLEQHGMTFLRLHGSVDEICILDDFAAQLELGPPVYRKGWVSIHEIEPCSFDRLIARVKRVTGMPALRVAAPPEADRPIRRIGLPWGGMGLFVNVAFQQELVEQKCDAFIAGESDCYAFRFATECGIGVIETSHELSEERGLCRFMAMLRQQFPDVRMTFEPTPHVWHIA